jgi:large subunit ribosomal protein L21
MSTYAIIESGSKQYWVEADQTIQVEKLGEIKGKQVELDRVLFYSDEKGAKVGTPVIAGAKVICEYLGEVKAKKVISFKFKRRKDYKRKVGHRQNYTELRVKEIKVK